MSLIALGFVAWCAFSVPLGARTFAEHLGRIGQTPEARELLDGTRDSVVPVVKKATERVLGEYVEAPTHVGNAAALADDSVPRTAPPPSRVAL